MTERSRPTLRELYGMIREQSLIFRHLSSARIFLNTAVNRAFWTINQTDKEGNIIWHPELRKKTSDIAVPPPGGVTIVDPESVESLVFGNEELRVQYSKRHGYYLFREHDRHKIFLPENRPRRLTSLTVEKNPQPGILKFFGVVCVLRSESDDPKQAGRPFFWLEASDREDRVRVKLK